MCSHFCVFCIHQVFLVSSDIRQLPIIPCFGGRVFRIFKLSQPLTELGEERWEIEVKLMMWRCVIKDAINQWVLDPTRSAR